MQPFAPDFFTFLNGSHRHLEEAGKRLLDAVTADDRTEMLSQWRELEKQLLAHLEAEERYMLPAFARADQSEAVALVKQHGEIRERLLELGVAVELHRLRVPMLTEFVELLRHHADREERLMYTWAKALLDDQISEPVRRHVASVT
jgi:hemerythrin-like domain-containing protein